MVYLLPPDPQIAAMIIFCFSVNQIILDTFGFPLRNHCTPYQANLIFYHVIFCHLSSTQTYPLCFPEHAKILPASGLLYLLFLLTYLFFLRFSVVIFPFFWSSLGTTVTSQRSFFQAHLVNGVLRTPPNYSVSRDCFFFHGSCHSLKLFIITYFKNIISDDILFLVRL